MPDPDMAQFTGVFRAGKPNRVKRNRQPVSCIACQRRKSKCDKRHPCGACDKRGEGDGCRFGSAPKPSGAQRQEVQMKLSRLEEMIKGFAGAEDAQAHTMPNGGPVSVGPETQGPARRQKSTTSYQQQPTNADRPPNPPSTASAPTIIQGTGTSPHSINSSSSDQTAQPYQGATAWSAVVTSIHDIQNMLQTDDDVESNPDLESPEEADQLLGTNRPIGIEEIKNSLPSKLFMDRLISCYFNAKFHAVPFIHAHQFRRHYEAFYEDPASTSFTWISILFSILGSGALLAKAKLTNEPGLLQSIEEPAFYLGISARCLVTGKYLDCKPGSVEAILQHAHSRNMQRQDEDRVLWALYALAVRMAQLQGYHRDPSKLPTPMSPFECEMRRRTWFMIQAADLLVALHSGLPPIIYESLTDTEHPVNLLDEDFDEDTAVLPPGRPPTDPTPILAYISKSELAVILRRVMVHALAVKRPPYEETLRLSDQLQAWHNSQPACLRIRSIRSTSFTDANYTIMHRIMLELMYRKCLCVLHRPYLTEHKDDPTYDRSRRICREAALAMLEMHIELDYEVSVQGRMYEDRFMVSNLTLHHFLIASTVVCVDLTESNDLQPAERQVCKGILQRSHDVWAARSAYSSDARHATKILRAVLNRIDTSPPPAGSTPEYDTGGTGSSPHMSLTGLEPPLAAMGMDFTRSLPASLQHMQLDPGGQLHPHMHQDPHLDPMANALHHHHPGMGPGAETGYPYTAPAGYVPMPLPDGEFAAAFDAPIDFDSLLYNTQNVNWVRTASVICSVYIVRFTNGFFRTMSTSSCVLMSRTQAGPTLCKTYKSATFFNN